MLTCSIMKKERAGGVGPVAWVRIENQTVNQGLRQTAKAGDAPVEHTSEAALKLLRKIF
jgi:hypothetical protein